MLKKLFRKFKKTEKEQNKEKKSSEDYPNRFLKFYHLNKKRLNKKRRSSYSERKKAGICVRCNKKSLPGIVFCQYHQEKQKAYNKNARS